MSAVLELELTYLASNLPDGLVGCKKAKLIDVYFPADADHANLRIRQKGAKFELTKKTQVDPNDAGKQIEENTALTAEEFKALAKGDGRQLAKTRYYMPYSDYIAEVDVFEGALKGLVLIDFEFETEDQVKSFAMPDFCLADVTQEEFIAGGILAGKSYKDIEADLARFNYQPL